MRFIMSIISIWQGWSNRLTNNLLCISHSFIRHHFLHTLIDVDYVVWLALIIKVINLVLDEAVALVGFDCGLDWFLWDAVFGAGWPHTPIMTPLHPILLSRRLQTYQQLTVGLISGTTKYFLNSTCLFTLTFTCVLFGFEGLGRCDGILRVVN